MRRPLTSAWTRFSFAQVTHVTTVHPPYRQYALKVLDKEHIKRERKTKYVLIERDTLKALDGHPGVVKLWWTFQDEWSLCASASFGPRVELRGEGARAPSPCLKAGMMD